MRLNEIVAASFNYGAYRNNDGVQHRSGLV